MKTLILTLAILASAMPVQSGELEIQARDWSTALEMKCIKYISTAKDFRSIPTDLFTDYHFIRINVKNHSTQAIHVNPHSFTLVTDNDGGKEARSYSSSTHRLDMLPFFNTLHTLDTVHLYPGTETDGFLLFGKQGVNEIAKILYFKTQERTVAAGVFVAGPEYRSSGF